MTKTSQTEDPAEHIRPAHDAHHFVGSQHLLPRFNLTVQHSYQSVTHALWAVHHVFRRTNLDVSVDGQSDAASVVDEN